jgi:hypothetical protein
VKHVGIQRSIPHAADTEHVSKRANTMAWKRSIKLVGKYHASAESERHKQAQCKGSCKEVSKCAREAGQEGGRCVSQQEVPPDLIDMHTKGAHARMLWLRRLVT